MAEVQKFLFTSESVTEGHPDKVADQVSDAVLDAVLAQDPTGRVACEVLVTTGICVVAGEITTNCYVDVPKIVRETIREIGYTDAAMGFDAKTCGVLNTIQGQSPDIAMGVDPGGAGDQGLMFGYACNETDELMPLPVAVGQPIEDEEADLVAVALAARRDDDVADRIDVEPDDVEQTGFRTADDALGRHITVRHALEHDNGAHARVGREDFVVDRVDRHGVRAHEPGPRALDGAQRRHFAGCVRLEHEHRAAERDRNHDLVVDPVVRDAVHRPGQVRRLAFNHPLRSHVSVCQPGKHRDSRYADSIGDKDFVALRIVGGG